MPNYVKNKLTISPSAFPRVCKECFSEDEETKERFFDFNKLIPMPDSIREVECGSHTTDGLLIIFANASERERARILKLIQSDMVFKGSITKSWELDYKDLLKYHTPEQIEACKAMAKLALENRRKYGAFCWYDWACDNWGTKWNACDSDTDNVEHTIVYETAWSAAFEIAQAISKRYHCMVTLDYADEDIGRNCGRMVCDNGEVVFKRYYEAESREAYIAACELWQLDISDFLEGVTWEDIDNETTPALA